MNIISAQYMNATNLHDGTTYKDNIKATIDGQEMFVPLDPANRHYQAILEWVEDGNTIEDAD
jgi:hypothetical protein